MLLWVTFLPYRADFTFGLSPKSKQKAQGCVRFTRKSYAITTKNPELPPTHWSLLKQQDFLTSLSLVFRLTDRGRRCELAFASRHHYNDLSQGGADSLNFKLFHQPES